MTRGGLPARVLPEDGTFTTPDQDPTEGGRYGPAWRSEEQTRERVLEADKNYQFLTLVAGAANAPVERMYDDDSIGRAFRARLAAEQVRMQMAETQQSASELEESLLEMEQRQLDAHVTLGAIANFRATDAVMQKLPPHEAAVRHYVAAQRRNVDRIALGNLLYTGDGVRGLQVASMFGSVIDRALTVLFSDSSGNDLGADQPDIGIAVGLPTPGASLTPQALMDLVFHGSGSVPGAWHGATMRSALANAYDDVFRHPPQIAGAASDEIGAGVGELALRTAVGRLILLQWLVVERVSDGYALPLGAYVAAANSTTLAAAAAFLDGPVLEDARKRYTDAAAAYWIEEARAFVGVVDTAFRLHDAESPLRAPRDNVPSATVHDIAVRARRDEHGRHVLAGGDEASSAIAGDEAAAKIRENPPNHIFAKTSTNRTAIRAAIDKVTGYVAVATAAGTPAAALAALQADFLRVGATDSALPPALAVTSGTRESHEAWNAARRWYEQLGGTLFRSVDSWRFGTDGVLGLTQGNAFPGRGPRGRDVPVWGLAGRGAKPPSDISAQMRALWDTYVPVYQGALGKINTSAEAAARAAAAKAAAPTAAAAAAGVTPNPSPSLPPASTQDEEIVYSALRGGTTIQNAQRESTDDVEVQWPIFVTMGRLLLADVAVTTAHFENSSAQRAAIITATRARLVAMRTGVPVPRAIVEPPYQHRRGWVERPEHSGVIKLKPIVVKAIGDAWGTLTRAAPHIVRAVGNNVEVLQQHPSMRVDFAELVAVQMAFIASLFQTRYHQLGQRAYNKIDWLDVVQRFQYSYDVGTGAPPQMTSSQFFAAAEGGGAAAAAVSAVRVRVLPTNASVGVRGYNIV